MPVSVGIGSFVYGGSLLLSGALKIKSTSSGDKSLISRLVQLVEKYKDRKARVERLVYRFSRFYLPSMLAIAVVSWFLLSPQVAIVVIAIACPSAFLIAITSTTLYSLATLSRMGVLSKGTQPIENASKVKIVAFDKTGTLTLGTPRVSKIVALNEMQPSEVLRLAASIEVASNHPLARAIVERAKDEGLSLLEFRDVKEIPGKGVVGRVDGFEVKVGSGDLVGASDVEDIESGPRAYVSVNGRVVGAILFEEESNPVSLRAIKLLKQMNIGVVLLTGDKKENAERVARSLDIEEFHAELRPSDKVSLIEDLRRRYGYVAMVGDGINDAPALAAADLGIAVGSLEAALEAGDVVITSHNLLGVPNLIRFSRRIVKIIFLNLGIVGAMKALVIILSALGLIPLWLAVAIGDDGSLALTLLNNVLLIRQSER